MKITNEFNKEQEIEEGQKIVIISPRKGDKFHKNTRSLFQEQRQAYIHSFTSDNKIRVFGLTHSQLPPKPLALNPTKTILIKRDYFWDIDPDNILKVKQQFLKSDEYKSMLKITQNWEVNKKVIPQEDIKKQKQKIIARNELEKKQKKLRKQEYKNINNTDLNNNFLSLNANPVSKTKKKTNNRQR